MGDKVFTEDEAMHLVAREVAKQRMSDMERLIKENDTKTSIAVAEVKIKIDSIYALLQQHEQARAQGAKEIREEMASEFASKSEMKLLESNIENKLDKLWQRVTLPITGVIATGLVVQYMLGIVSYIR